MKNEKNKQGIRSTVFLRKVKFFFEKRKPILSSNYSKGSQGKQTLTTFSVHIFNGKEIQNPYECNTNKMSGELIAF